MVLSYHPNFCSQCVTTLSGSRKQHAERELQEVISRLVMWCRGWMCSVTFNHSFPLRVKQKLQSAKGPTAGRMKSYSGVKQNVVSASKYLPSFHVHFISQRINLLRSLVLSSSEPLLASNSTINNVPLSKSTSCHSLCYWDKPDRTHTVFRI